MTATSSDYPAPPSAEVLKIVELEVISIRPLGFHCLLQSELAFTLLARIMEPRMSE